MNKLMKFFVFDSDESVIQQLSYYIKIIYPNAEIVSAMDGEQGWNLLLSHNSQSFIISEVYLNKLNGLQLLQNIKAKENLKDSFVIMTFDGISKEESLKALKLGADALFQKPVTIDGLISILKTASKILNLQQQLKTAEAKIQEFNQIINEDILKMSEILYKFQELRIPNIEKKSTFIAEAVSWIARKLGDVSDFEIEQFVNAAKLSYLGKVGLPDKIIDKPVTKSGLIYGENMSNVPILARDMANLVRNYEEVANILYHVFENFDGSGYPKKLKGWQIPLGSRLIRVAFDYIEYLEETKNDYSKSIQALYHESKRLYDYKIVAFFDQFLGSKSLNSTKMREKAISFKELTDGLVLSRNIILESGIVLLGEGTYIKSEHVDKILQIKKSDPYIGDIYIYIR